MDPPCPVAVDPIDDCMSKAFGSLPERLYVIHDDVIKVQGLRGPMGYHLDVIQDWLENFTNKKEN